MKILLSLATLSSFLSITYAQAQLNFIAGQIPGVSISGNQVNSTSACDTIFSFPAVDSWTGGLTYDGTYLWSGGYDAAYFYKHNLAGTVIDSVLNPSLYALGYMGGDLEFDGTNIWFFQEESDTLYKLDPTTGNVLSRFRIASCSSNCYGVAYDGTHLWISNYSPQALYKVDAATGLVINTFPISTSSYMLPIKFINGKLYGLGVFPGVVYEIDTTSGNVISSIPWCLGYSLGFCVADNHLWGSSSQLSTGGTKRIYQFDSLLLSDQTNWLSQVNTIEIYPNPSTGTATLSFEKIIEKGSIEITDILGKVIYTSIISDASEFEINLQTETNGVYFVKVYDGKNYGTAKMIVVK